jgi:hypothetical protein
MLLGESTIVVCSFDLGLLGFDRDRLYGWLPIVAFFESCGLLFDFVFYFPFISSLLSIW